jgi:hypothetical protein
MKTNPQIDSQLTTERVLTCPSGLIKAKIGLNKTTDRQKSQYVWGKILIVPDQDFPVMWHKS